MIDGDQLTATINANARYGQISRQLHSEGYALHNLASLPHISVAGACATATHGSGELNGCLAAAVTEMEIVTAGGEIVVLSGDLLPGAAVGLGGLGVITKVTLNLEPTFQMRQVVYENLPLAQLERHFDEIESTAYSVSLFTDWRNETINQVWLKSRVEDAPFSIAPDLYGAVPAPDRGARPHQRDRAV